MPDIPPTAAREPGLLRRALGFLEFSTLLRLAGGGVTVMAILMFLLQRWDDAGDLQRYGLMAGETLLLTLLGFGTSRWLREPKSARLFLGLSLVSTTALFTVLAAMVHSQLQGVVVAAHYPAFALWDAGSLDTLLLLLAGSFALATLQSLIGFSVLARPAARGLSLLMLCNLGLLLLPPRHMGMTALLALPAAAFGLYQLRQWRARLPALRTTEGGVAGLLMLLPLLIMLGRGTYLYADELVAVGSLALLSYLILRQGAQAIRHAGLLRRLLETASLVPALIAGLTLCAILEQQWPWHEQWSVALLGAVMAGALWDLSRRALHGSGRYRDAVFQLALVLAALEMLLWPGIASAVLAIALSAVTALQAYRREQRGRLRLALLALAGALVLLAIETLGRLELANWMGLAVLGMGSILVAAAVERHGQRIKLVVQRLRG